MCISLNSQNNKDSLFETKKKLKITEPIQSLESFKEFDQKIHSDKAHADGLVIFVIQYKFSNSQTSCKKTLFKI